MNKLILLLLVSILFGCSSSKKVKDEIEQSDNLVISTVEVDRSEEAFINKYVDSIYAIKSREDIPAFLLNACFDYDNAFYSRTRHNPKSLRIKIISRIQVVHNLKIILLNKDLVSDEVCENKLEHPYGGQPSLMDGQELTTLNLVKKRISEINQKWNISRFKLYKDTLLIKEWNSGAATFPVIELNKKEDFNQLRLEIGHENLDAKEDLIFEVHFFCNVRDPENHWDLEKENLIFKKNEIFKALSKCNQKDGVIIVQSIIDSVRGAVFQIKILD